MRNVLLIFAALVALICTTSNASAQTVKAATPYTALHIYNASNRGVRTAITVPGGSEGVGCATTVEELKLVDAHTHHRIQIEQQCGNPQVGFFNMARGETLIVTNTFGACLAGINVAFGAEAQCPCNSFATCTQFEGKNCRAPERPFITSLIDGTNVGEVTLNLSGGQDTADISCTNGANASIRIFSTGGPGWVEPASSCANPRTIPLDIRNSYVDIAGNFDANCGLLGVFPYNCTNCNAIKCCTPLQNGPGPGACPGLSGVPLGNCTSGNSTCCQVSRNTNSFGGLVTIEYLGPQGIPL